MAPLNWNNAGFVTKKIGREGSPIPGPHKGLSDRDGVTRPGASKPWGRAGFFAARQKETFYF